VRNVTGVQDVCSSDLTAFAVTPATANTATRINPYRPRRVGAFIYLAPDGGVPGRIDCGYHRGVLNLFISAHREPTIPGAHLDTEIGRATCRERAETDV